MAEGWHDQFREEALAMAADALTTAMDFYFDDRRPVPAPSAQDVNRLTDLHNDQDRHDLTGAARDWQTSARASRRSVSSSSRWMVVDGHWWWT